MEINTNHNNKLLVVGGTGFIGRHIVKKSLDLGFKTTSLSKNNPADKEKIKRNIKRILTFIRIVSRQKLNHHYLQQVLQTQLFLVKLPYQGHLLLLAFLERLSL